MASKCSLQLFVTPRSVFAAIGTKGIVISQTESETGCKISFEKQDDLINHQKLRVCTVDGPDFPTVLEGVKRIWDADEEFVEARIAVPDPLVAALIGKGGVIIKDIQDNTSVELSFAKPHEMGSLEGHTRCLTLKGDRGVLVRSIEYIYGIIGDRLYEYPRAHQEGGRAGQQQYHHDQQGYGGQGYEQRGGYQQGGGRRDHHGGGGHGGRIQNSNIASGGRGGDRRGERSSAANYGRGPNGEVKLDFFIFGELVSLAIGKGGSNIKKICEETGNPIISFSDNNESGFGFCNRPLRRVNVCGTAESVMHAATVLATLDEEVESGITMLVHDSIVSKIIGSNGSQIRAITDQFGAYLSFAKPHEMAHLNGSERALTIKGNGQQIVGALGEVINVLQADAPTQADSSPGRKRSRRRDYDDKEGGKRRRHKEEAQDADIEIHLPVAFKGHVDDTMLVEFEQNYGVRCYMRNLPDELVIHITGDQAPRVQQDIQGTLFSTAGPVKWRMEAMA